MSEESPSVPFPEPDLAPRPITLDEYMELTPEKLELWQGYLIGPPDWPTERIQLMSLLLTNVGLVETVKLAPKERWEQALRLAFPST